MLRIKFSHKYEKFRDVGVKLPTEAILLQCLLIERKDINPKFEYYDCIFCDDKKTADIYELPKGKLIVLLLWNMKNLFTTIRRYTPRKWEYYKSHEGDEFELVKV